MTEEVWLVFAVTVAVAALVFCCMRCFRSTRNHRQESEIEQYRSFLRIPPSQLLQAHDNHQTLSVYATNMLRQALQYASLTHFLQWSEVPASATPTSTVSAAVPPTTATPAPIFDIVLAYYKVNPVGWLMELARQLPETIFPSQVRIFIYAKATDPGDPEFDADAIRATYPESWRDRLIIVPLQNVGRCDHTYVYHIVTQVSSASSASSPARYTVFLKDRTASDVKLEVLLKWFANPRDEFTGVYGGSTANNLADFRHAHAYYTLHDQNQNRDTFLTAPDFLQPLHSWMKVITQNPDLSKNVYAPPQYKGIFMVPTATIRNTSRETWIRAGISLCYGRNIETGHYMERVWATLLGAGSGDGHIDS